MGFGDENGIDHGGNWIWIDPLSYGMDTIYNLDWGTQHGSCVLGQIGNGRQATDCLHNKGSKATASELCEMKIQDWYCWKTIQLVEMDGI